MDRKEKKRWEKWKARKAARLRSQFSIGGQVDATLQVAPAGMSTAQVVADLVQACDPSGRLLAVVEREDGDLIALLPVEDRRRLEELEPRFKGQLVVRVMEDQAKTLGIF